MREWEYRRQASVDRLGDGDARRFEYSHEGIFEADMDMDTGFEAGMDIEVDDSSPQHASPTLTFDSSPSENEIEDDDDDEFSLIPSSDSNMHYPNPSTPPLSSSYSSGSSHTLALSTQFQHPSFDLGPNPNPENCSTNRTLEVLSRYIDAGGCGIHDYEVEVDGDSFVNVDVAVNPLGVHRDEDAHAGCVGDLWD
jgi:hypothetical protein